jgi:hypothetical protein
LERARLGSRPLANDVAYPWPVAPFDRQHPVRGFFGDPRIGDEGGRSFHTGIDISAPDGTPVHAVAPGRVSIGGPQNVVVATPGRNFGYWHVVPAVANGDHVPLHGLLGHVAAGWGHVHFAEHTTTPARQGTYWNPLRAEALTPFADYGPPRVSRVISPGNVLFGDVDLAAEALDHPPIAPPPPWSTVPVTPALVRWRLLHGSGVAIPWRIVADFRVSFRPHVVGDSEVRFGSIYAPGTRQSHPGQPGLFRYWLGRRLDTRHHRDGRYQIEVEATDVRGNRGRREFPVTINNAHPPV